jgi:hypothetical protein
VKNEKGFSPEKLMQLEEQAENHCWDNKAEIERSEICMCMTCYQRFQPNEITNWQDGKSAVCPNPKCGLGGSIIGSASGLNFDDYDYS